MEIESVNLMGLNEVVRDNIVVFIELGFIGYLYNKLYCEASKGPEFSCEITKK